MRLTTRRRSTPIGETRLQEIVTPRTNTASITAAENLFAAISLADFAQRQVEIVMNDQQPSGSGPPAFDRFQHDVAAVVHEAVGQDETRAGHRHGDQAGGGA